MKRFAAALIALPLLAGCGGGASVETVQPAVVEQAAPAEVAPNVELPEAREPTTAPIVLDLSRQTLTVPTAAHGTLSVPVLALGGINTGTEMTSASPDWGSYSHCEDETAGWAREPDPQDDAEHEAHMIQFITWSADCWEIPFTTGLAVIVPRQIAVEDGPTVTLNELLPPDAHFTVSGTSPIPDANYLTLGLVALGKINVNWPTDTEAATRVS